MTADDFTLYRFSTISVNSALLDTLRQKIEGESAAPDAPVPLNTAAPGEPRSFPDVAVRPLTPPAIQVDDDASPPLQVRLPLFAHFVYSSP